MRLNAKLLISGTNWSLEIKTVKHWWKWYDRGRRQSYWSHGEFASVFVFKLLGGCIEFQQSYQFPEQEFRSKQLDADFDSTFTRKDKEELDEEMEWLYRSSKPLPSNRYCSPYRSERAEVNHELLDQLTR